MSGLGVPRRRRRRLPLRVVNPERIADESIGHYLRYLELGYGSELARELATRQIVERIALTAFAGRG